MTTNSSSPSTCNGDDTRSCNCTVQDFVSSPGLIFGRHIVNAAKQTSRTEAQTAVKNVYHACNDTSSQEHVLKAGIAFSVLEILRGDPLSPSYFNSLCETVPLCLSELLRGEESLTEENQESIERIKDDLLNAAQSYDTGKASGANPQTRSIVLTRLHSQSGEDDTQKQKGGGCKGFFSGLSRYRKST